MSIPANVVSTNLPVLTAAVVPTVNVENIYGRVLRNYCSVATDDFGIEPPYQIELGVLGLSGAVLGINRHGMSAPIYQDRFKLRRILNDVTAGTQKKLIGDFLDALFDLAGSLLSRRQPEPFLTCGLDTAEPHIRSPLIAAGTKIPHTRGHRARKERNQSLSRHLAARTLYGPLAEIRQGSASLADGGVLL